LEAIQPAFTLDEFSTPAVNLISCRVAKSDDFEKLSPTYDNDKGIMLLGPIGSGKTLLMQGLIEVARYFDPMSTFRILPTYALTEEFARNGVDVYSRFRVGSSEVNPSVDGLVLDDMGAEAIMNHYGQPTNVIAELILRRYDQRAQTFGTSNLDQKTLRRFYGERVWSRLKSMVNFIELKGHDRRK
jgi:DNA replication protein DnaC